MGELISELFQLALETGVVLGILVVIGYLLRDSILHWLANKVEENTQTRLKILEQSLELEKSRIDSIRQVAVSGTVARNVQLANKHVDSAAVLWSGLIASNKRSMAVELLKSLRTEKIDELIAFPDGTQIIDALSEMAGVDRLLESVGSKDPEALKKTVDDWKDATHVRPFVSGRAWNLYAAHSMITTHAITSIVVWKNGLKSEFMSHDELRKRVLVALPHQKVLLDNYGVYASYYLLSELEEALLKELKEFLLFGEDIQNNVNQATDLVDSIE
ncbi:MAG: hypothetical protein JJ894_03970 [Dinoroseobacter sp.]|nr:hypothetical protein [Dinoroseobacter sp.]